MQRLAKRTEFGFLVLNGRWLTISKRSNFNSWATIGNTHRLFLKVGQLQLTSNKVAYATSCGSQQGDRGYSRERGYQGR